MKIAHVVSYVSEDGAFGGPVAVAVAQSSELARTGDRVDLIAGWDGKYSFNVEGVTPRLFPVRNVLKTRLTGLISLRMLLHIWKFRHEYDIFHIHMGRDLATSFAAQVALICGIPFVTQTHGMIMPDHRRAVRVLDALIIRRLLIASVRVLAISPAEKAGIDAITRGRAKIEMTTNGLTVRKIEKNMPGPDRPKVVFLARLHPRKRVLVFAEAAVSLLRGGSTAEFEVYGPDEGDLPALKEFITESGCDRLVYRGAVSPGTGPAVLAGAAVYVLPSYGEVVPMSVLESMSVGTPVVLTSDCAMASYLSECEAAIVTNGSVDEVANAISRLLDNKILHSMISENATKAVEDFYSISSITAEIRRFYESSVA